MFVIFFGVIGNGTVNFNGRGHFKFYIFERTHPHPSQEGINILLYTKIFKVFF